MTNKLAVSNISLSALYPDKTRSVLGRLLLTIGDKLMGLDALNDVYRQSHLPGLDKQSFCRELLRYLKTPLVGATDLKKQIPEQGSCIVVSNHPFGCLEGVGLAHELGKLRSDVKVLANKALGMFKEIESHFIFIDPLSPKDPANMTALKACKQHLDNGGVLVVFPSGKVSDYESKRARVCDDDWNRVAAQLARRTDSPVVPVFFEGHNSPEFIRWGRVWTKTKLLMMFREILKRQGQPIQMRVGQCLPTKLLAKLKSVETINDYLRLQSHLLDSRYEYQWPDDIIDTMQPLAPEGDKRQISAELGALPDEQVLTRYKGFTVYYGYQSQLSTTVKEIARQRERVFRLHNEGSGQPIDTDSFDATYVHLFIVQDSTTDIIGAYRMGQTDKLLAKFGEQGLYLSKMFNFKQEFINHTEPCLEMGRSFIVPEHQRSFYGLYLLWRGIGEYVVRHPQYRTLYGTVSLSKLYRPESVECIRQVMTEPSDQVSAKSPFAVPINPEITEFFAKHHRQDGVLSAVVQGWETDSKDVPVLMKQYQKMAARFYCIGIDESFNDTPGMLLSVHLPSAPKRSLKQYLAEGLESYLQYRSN